jgi:hypothetical protein
MELSRNDWRAYANFLESQLGEDLRDEVINSKVTFVKHYNQFMVKKELESVNSNKIYVKA